ncbi:MAG TPA: ABC-three component system middle component 8 [Oleiagrimonas sp.]|nr:ABC-three component system middle component 8 [Oleiagrimonas sp.]
MRLRKRRLEDYNNLLSYAKKAVIGGDVLFLPSLNFLFLLGLIEYRPKTDAIEYVGPNDAV